MTKTYDPRMHTAEHILNAVMDRKFGSGRCFNAHIEKKKSRCDYRLLGPLTEEDIREVEDTVNEVIHSNLPVTEEWLSKDRAAERYNLERLPADTGERVRIIRVGDVDACTCIGPHVASIREIGRFHIASHSLQDGVLRIRYKLTGPTLAG